MPWWPCVRKALEILHLCRCIVNFQYLPNSTPCVRNILEMWWSSNVSFQHLPNTSPWQDALFCQKPLKEGRYFACASSFRSDISNVSALCLEHVCVWYHIWSTFSNQRRICEPCGMGQSPWPFRAGAAGWWLSGRLHIQLCLWFSQWCSLPPPIQRRLDPLDLQRLCLSWGDMAFVGLHGHVGTWASLCQRSLHPLLFRKNEDNAEIGNRSGRCKRPWRPFFRLQGPWLPPATGGCPPPHKSPFFSTLRAWLTHISIGVMTPTSFFGRLTIMLTEERVRFTSGSYR